MIAAADLNLSVAEPPKKNGAQTTAALADPESAATAVDTTGNTVNEAEIEKAGEQPLMTLPQGVDSLESYLEGIEKSVIIDALETTRWNKTAAAKKLGITFRALRYKLKKLDLE